MTFILNIFLISFFCAGLAISMQPGMIFHEPFKKLWSLVAPHEYLVKIVWPPIAGCVYCLASFWGSIIYWPLELIVWDHAIEAPQWIMWPITCVCCIFMNGFFYQLLTLIENINENKGSDNRQEKA